MNNSRKRTIGESTTGRQLSSSRKFPVSAKIPLLAVVFLLVLTLIRANSLSAQQRTLTKASGTSPYICGVNNDSQMIQRYPQIKQIGVTTVRFGYGPNLQTNLHNIKNAELQPLLILHGCGTSDPTQRLEGNIQMVQQAQQVFGAGTRIFYEIGNENDLQCGLSAAAYTSMWNAVVGQLKQIAPNSWFGGPVNFQQNPSYVATFVQTANPKPDFISWHEYTCSSSQAKDYCISHIANWTTHITNTKAAITGVGAAVPPIFITEWNYAPDGGVTSDNKHNDPAFMTQWTTTALQTLIKNNVYESNQFNVSNATPILGSAQGQAFQSICQ